MSLMLDPVSQSRRVAQQANGVSPLVLRSPNTVSALGVVVPFQTS